MTLPLASAFATRLEFLDECGSTNTELMARAADAWPDFSVVATANQTAGRGRLNRVWVAPPGQTLAVSVLLRPTFSLESFGWLPLIAGLAMARAVGQQLPSSGSVAIKWPNDVQVDGLKVSGLLAELLPTADGVVIGAGLNLTIPADGLPTPNATSLVLNGADPDDLLDRALAAYLRELKQLYVRFAEHDGDAEASGIRLLVQQQCSTVGQQVRIELPGGTTRFGDATGIDGLGRLLYTDRADGTVQAVAAGDVTHLRYE
ncbi:MAG TPA: biotin--[acetyl-CoA-carboxylase] ligase [Homoserinimonas sp.]|nr:biotin--[acetyl-CoA-carboxylase] ligase [Homoserinimonas sp.]